MNKKYLFFGLFLAAVLIIFSVFVLIVVSEFLINQNSEGRLYDSVESIPKKKVGLVLGSSPLTSFGTINRFYEFRIDAAEELFRAGKVDFLLLSGDNSTPEYNEPQAMKDDLVERGIPEDRIFLDYAGFRTWDSIIRAKEVFGENDFVVISQKFHNQRALFVASQNGITAIGFNAQDVPTAISPRVWLRERLASVNAVVDVLIGREPKFFGDQIVIE